MNAAKRDCINVKQFIAIEEELVALKEKNHIVEKEKWWMKAGDYVVARFEKKPVILNKKRYIRLELSCGWFCGAHRFFAGQKGLGSLYFILCWSGIPFAMTLIDLIIAIPRQTDENGNICLYL